ncbi:MAG: ureidoglycolate lyase [Pseudomonadota bacterium]
MRTITPEPLTREAFAPFGEVIQTDGAHQFDINSGTTTRFHALATAEVGAEARAILSIFRGRRRPALTIEMLECHPLGSQAFMPLSNDDWLVVVAEEPNVQSLRCFRAAGNQGVSYAPAVWHHPLLVLGESQDFLVVDRLGPGENLQEAVLPEAAEISL